MSILLCCPLGDSGKGELDKPWSRSVESRWCRRDMKAEHPESWGLRWEGAALRGFWELRTGL